MSTSSGANPLSCICVRAGLSGGHLRADGVVVFVVIVE